jgi:predicted 3-demethylubiquinone-9 3-methyltransferase (glyoxalase superfamily)
VSIFTNSRIVSISRYGDAGPGPKGSVMTDPDPRKAKRVADAMLKMKKIDIAGLKKAHES